MSPRAAFVFAPLFMALSACQQAAWKAGANADDLKRDEQTCGAQRRGDQDAIKRCLRDKGWTITEFNRPDDSDEAAPSGATPAAVESAPSPLDKPVSANGAATGSMSGGATATHGVPSAGAAAAQRSADPLQRQAVQTWWKAGAQAADFNGDAGACQEQLGAQHTPDYAQHLYTRAMVQCLRARGWMAGHDPVYTPLR